MNNEKPALTISRGAYDAVIFDLDGVITQTASLHATAWKALFDEYLEGRGERQEEWTPFDMEADYLRYVDGKPRYEGVRSFLESRGIELPYGDPDDPPERETVCGLGNKKNPKFLGLVKSRGVEVFDSSVRLLEKLEAHGIKTAIVSSSKNCVPILEATYLTDAFDVKVDGVDAAEQGLAGKPHPDTFLEAARQLGIDPARAVIVEDAISGVQAGRSGKFGCVLGVDRAGQAAALKENGADVVVTDLVEVDVSDSSAVVDANGQARASALKKSADATWSLVYDGFDPQEEGLREALCTLGNGYFCTRGAAPETEADDIHYPGTYLAGGYNRLKTEMAGRMIENEDLVNMPNWLPLGFRIGGGNWFRVRAVDILDYRQELDMRKGILTRNIRFRDKEGHQVSLAERRLVHMGNPHLAALETKLTAENWSGRIEIRSALDGRVINGGVERYRSLNSKHLEPIETRQVNEETIYLKVQTNQSEIRVAEAARTRILLDGKKVESERRCIEEDGYIAQDVTFYVEQGQTVTVVKTIAFYTSRDQAIYECGHEARKALTNAGGFEELLHSHILAWELLGRRFNSEGEPADLRSERSAEMIVRLHLFHLLQSVSPHTAELDVGVPARGWHGEAYRGHVFWDELFIFPTLNLRIPEITRSLLLYRCRRLDEARAAARRVGCRGAMYPWQSGSNGREETQSLHLNPRSGRWLPDSSRLQRHVNLAIAYNVWQYYQATHDMEFLAYHGAEMMLEIARFWASIATYNADLNRYEILGVMGPDEYHEAYPDSEEAGLNNNAYTNVMTVWVLCRAMDVLDTLSDHRRRELCEMLHLGPEELEHWEDVSRKMRVPIHADGIISQFEGYEDLLEFDWEGYREKYGNIQRLDRILESEGDSPNNYKLSKQADVCMLFYLFSYAEVSELFERLGYTLQPDAIPKNIDYYMKRTSHGSTLSRIVHSWVLLRSDPNKAWEFFTDALESDISDSQGGTTREGIHLGAMAGSVDLIQRGFTGITTREDVLWLDPCLPSQLKWFSMRVRYRNNLLVLIVSQDKIKVISRKVQAGPIKIGIVDTIHEIGAGESREFALTATNP